MLREGEVVVLVLVLVLLLDGVKKEGIEVAVSEFSPPVVVTFEIGSC